MHILLITILLYEAIKLIVLQIEKTRAHKLPEAHSYVDLKFSAKVIISFNYSKLSITSIFQKIDSPTLNLTIATTYLFSETSPLQGNRI